MFCVKTHIIFINEVTEMRKKALVSILSFAVAICLLFSGCGSAVSKYEVPVQEDMAMDVENSYAYHNNAEESGTYYRDADKAAKERMLVYDIDYTLETKEFETTCSALENKAVELGGYVSSFNHYTSSYQTGTDYSFRIPSARLNEFSTLVESLGTVTRKSTEVMDYTDNYYDYQTEIDLLRTEEEYIVKYIDLASDSGERAELIDQLLSVRREIARLERASKSIIETVTYSTVDISVREVTVFTDIKVSYGDTLLSAFKEGWEDFADFCREVLYGVVRISPLFTVVFVVFLAIWIPVKVSKSRKKKKMIALAKEQAARAAVLQQNNRQDESL